MNQQQECNECEHRYGCEMARKDLVARPGCEAYTEPGTSAVDVLVKAAEDTLASALEAGQIQVGLCLSLLALKLALEPFQEE